MSVNGNRPKPDPDEFIGTGFNLEISKSEIT
jgi:hypothetical protein